MHNIIEKLQLFYDFLEQETKPYRAKLDNDTQALTSAFQDMAKHHALGYRLPESFGGLDLNSSDQYYFYQHIARASGALMLLQTQHQSVQSLIHSFADKKFQQDWLTASCAGEIGFGIGFSHLHQVENPPVIAEEKEDHFIVNGTIHYATGFGILNWLALGFFCGEEIFIALIPFKESDNFILKYVLPLVAANSTQTISFEVKNLMVPKDKIFYRQNKFHYREMTIRSRQFPALHIGTALAVLDLIKTSPTMNNAQVKLVYDNLLQKIKTYENEFFLYPEGELTAPMRVKALALLKEIFFFADRIFKGAASLKTHPLILLKNEAQLFSALASENEMLKSTCDYFLL